MDVLRAVKLNTVKITFVWIVKVRATVAVHHLFVYHAWMGTLWQMQQRVFARYAQQQRTFKLVNALHVSKTVEIVTKRHNARCVTIFLFWTQIKVRVKRVHPPPTGLTQLSVSLVLKAAPYAQIQQHARNVKLQKSLTQIKWSALTLSVSQQIYSRETLVCHVNQIVSNVRSSAQLRI